MVLYIFGSMAFLALLCIVEAKLESIIIKLKTMATEQTWHSAEYADLNRKEHQWSAFYYLVVVLGCVLVAVAIFKTNWLAVVFLTTIYLAERRLFFDFSLKLFRKRPLWLIDGDQIIDNVFRQMYGQHGGIGELGFLIVLIAACTYATIRFFV